MATQGNAARRRFVSRRRSRRRIRLSSGGVALALVGGAWLAGLGAHPEPLDLRHERLAQQLHARLVRRAERSGRRTAFPLHMPVLGHGDAYAFPYGFMPWVTAALLRPVFGDWIVTLWLVRRVSRRQSRRTWWAFPELRGGWWTALLLANPMLVEAVLLGQLPFLWATALLFAAIARVATRLVARGGGPARRCRGDASGRDPADRRRRSCSRGSTGSHNGRGCWRRTHSRSHRRARGLARAGLAGRWRQHSR